MSLKIKYLEKWHRFQVVEYWHVFKNTHVNTPCVKTQVCFVLSLFQIMSLEISIWKWCQPFMGIWKYKYENNHVFETRLDWQYANSWCHTDVCLNLAYLFAQNIMDNPVLDACNVLCYHSRLEQQRWFQSTLCASNTGQRHLVVVDPSAQSGD